MNEEWKFINGFNKDYAISNKGQVKSYHRKIIMLQQIVNGLKRVTLVKAGEKTHLYIHRLVAEHFIENPRNYRLVKHIDNNILNNGADNLMWVEYFEVLKQERSPHIKKTFYMYDLNGALLKTFFNLTQAVEHLHKIGFEKANYSGIKKACIGGIKTYLGFVWTFEANEQNVSADDTLEKIKDIMLSHEPHVVKLIKIDKLLFKGEQAQ
jgi:hypothetical protein